jgi:hypothetical protein
MMRALFLVLFVIAFPFFAEAQNWVPLGGGINESECEFFVLDESELLVVGNFWLDANAQMFNGIARWDGESFSTLTEQNAIQFWAGSVKNPVLFNDQLVFTYTSIHPFEGFAINRLGVFSEGTVSSPVPITERPSALCVYDDRLVIATKQTAQNGPTFYLWDEIALDSISITNFQTEEVFIDHVDELIVYNGKLYGAGTFRFEQGDVHGIFSWSEENGFGNLNGGIPGEHAHVSCLEVHGDELIIGGQFWQADGNSTNCIVRWNGTEMLPMGEIGADARVDALKSYGGYLYAAGWFETMDGIPCRIARWNGNEWEAFDNSVFGYGASDDGAFWDIEVFQDELYVSGPFLVIDYGFEYFYSLAKYSGPLSLVLNTNNQAASASTKVYPNPAADVITLESRQFLNQAAELVCRDALGRELLRTTWPQGNLQFALNLGHLKAGLYFVVIETDNACETHRIIKE